MLLALTTSMAEIGGSADDIRADIQYILEESKSASESLESHYWRRQLTHAVEDAQTSYEWLLSNKSTYPQDDTEYFVYSENITSKEFLENTEGDMERVTFNIAQIRTVRKAIEEIKETDGMSDNILRSMLRVTVREQKSEMECMEANAHRQLHELFSDCCETLD